jgi:hypothetical protein
MTEKKNPNRRSAQVQIPSFVKSIKEEQDRQLAEIKPTTVLGGEDSGIHAHKLLENPDAHHISALRREMMDYWPNLWQQVGYVMAHKAEDFVAGMNAALDMKLQLDGNKVDATCTAYLNELRRLRGLSGFTTPAQGG